jgi:TetR/AcrR family transcriptional regulator, cholesterol catabolism regulator
MNTSDAEVRNRILDKARDHFLQFGFSTVTMSEIAADLGMSKKTVYAFFPSKEDLASEMVKGIQAEITSQLNLLVEDEEMDFIEKLKRILDITAEHHSKLTPHFRMDLQKHAPGACKCTDEFQNQQIHDIVGKVIHEGITEGVFRRDIDEAIVTSMFIAAFKSLMRPESLARIPHSVPDVVEAISKVMFEGILTENGHGKVHARLNRSQEPSVVQ